MRHPKVVRADGRVMELMQAAEAKDKRLGAKLRQFFQDVKDLIRDTIDRYKDAVPGSPEGRLIRKLEDIYSQLQEAFAEGIMDAGTNFQNTEDNVANDGDLRYSKSAKVFFKENVFPPYNKSQSDAHEWAERWARSESAQIQNKKLVSYHNGWYLIQAFDDLKYGYQIIERIKSKDYEKVADYYGTLTGYESIQDTSGQNAALLRKARESRGIGHRSNSHTAQHRGENSEIYGMGTTQNGRRETDSNSGRNSGSGGEDSRRQEGSSLIDSDGNQLSADTENPTDYPDIRYSIGSKTDGAVQALLEKENDALREDVARLKELLKLQGTETHGTRFTPSSVEAAARYLKKNAGAKGDTKALAKLLNGFQVAGEAPGPNCHSAFVAVTL